MIHDKDLEQISQLLLGMAKLIVDSPSEVTIESIRDSKGIAFKIHSHRQDVGRLIGAQGRTARSLRHIIDGMGMKIGYRIMVEISPL